MIRDEVIKKKWGLDSEIGEWDTVILGLLQRKGRSLSTTVPGSWLNILSRFTMRQSRQDRRSGTRQSRCPRKLGRLNKAVDDFAEKMKLRLANKARAGYTGWDDAKKCTRLDIETRLMKKAQRGSAGGKDKD